MWCSLCVELFVFCVFSVIMLFLCLVMMGFLLDEVRMLNVRFCVGLLVSGIMGRCMFSSEEIRCCLVVFMWFY